MAGPRILRVLKIERDMTKIRARWILRRAELIGPGTSCLSVLWESRMRLFTIRF